MNRKQRFKQDVRARQATTGRSHSACLWELTHVVVHVPADAAVAWFGSAGVTALERDDMSTGDVIFT